MLDTNKLKLCPFCGNKELKIDDEQTGQGSKEISCIEVQLGDFLVINDNIFRVIEINKIIDEMKMILKMHTVEKIRRLIEKKFNFIDKVEVLE